MKVGLQALMRSATDYWGTPAHVYQTLDAEFHFNFDTCPLNPEWTVDGSSISWEGKRVFCNPPYGPGLRPFLDQAARMEAQVSVFLIPARTDTRWFHEIVLPFASEIRFIKGRLKFGDAKKSAPFPSMIVVFDRKKTGQMTLPMEENNEVQKLR